MQIKITLRYYLTPARMAIIKKSTHSKCWSFSSSISPSSEYSGLISLKIDWFELLDVQGTFRSLVQHHSLKASVLWHSAFFLKN